MESRFLCVALPLGYAGPEYARRVGRARGALGMVDLASSFATAAILLAFCSSSGVGGASTRPTASYMLPDHARRVGISLNASRPIP